MKILEHPVYPVPRWELVRRLVAKLEAE